MAPVTVPASLAPLGSLRPGVVGPMRRVPDVIPRPRYVDLDAAPRDAASTHVQDADTIEALRVACRLAARALAEVGRAVVPGATTDELDRVGHEFLVDHGAYPSTLGYPGNGTPPRFTKSLCTSVNEVVCHGIPDSTVLVEGDIVNVDITAYLVTGGIGVHGDTNATFEVGTVDEESHLLVERTREATMRGIHAVAPGRAVNVIGRVIESYARRFGYGVVREFSGHGIGTAFHSGLVIPHYDAAPHSAEVMVPGMTFTVEPMINLGTHAWDLWDDGWTVVTRDRRRSAQFEHTVLVTESGVEILTTS